MALYDPKETMTVLQGAIAELIGKKYLDADYELSALNDTAIVELGEKLNLTADGDFNENGSADIVYKSLLSQIGKVIIDSRSYTASLPKLYVDPVNWGLFEEIIMFDLADCMIDEMWNPAGYIPWNAPDEKGKEEALRIAAIEYGYYSPKVTTKLYKKAKAVSVPLTTEYDQLFTAFRGVDELNRFIAAKRNSVNNTIQLKAEVFAKMTVSVGIAKAMANGNAIDLREIAIEKGIPNAESMPAQMLLINPIFQKYLLELISNTKDYIKDYTAFYNNGEIATFAVEPTTILLSQVEKACKFGVRANTFNENLLGIGDYDTINSWQAAVSATNKTPYNFSAASSIDLTKGAAVDIGLLAGTSTEKHYLIKNVIGVTYDRMAMGITVDKKKVTANYAASRDTTNTFSHFLFNYAVNDSYPIVAYYISDPMLPAFVSPTVEAAPTDTDFWGTTASQMQTSISVSGDNKITGTLHLQTSGQIVSDWGTGYFIGLHITANDSSVTKIQCGLNPSAGSSLVTLDEDGLAMFKISDKDIQKFVVVQSNDNGDTWRYVYDLSGLTLSTT